MSRMLRGRRQTKRGLCRKNDKARRFVAYVSVKAAYQACFRKTNKRLLAGMA